MKFLAMTLVVLMCTSAVHAQDNSSCHEKCFLSKASCDGKKSHTFNSCEPELIACKSSCQSGKPHEAYRKSPSLEIALSPVMDIDLL